MPEITIGKLRGGLCAIWYDADGTRRRYQLAARDRKAAEAEALELYRLLSPRKSALTVADLWAAYRVDTDGRRIAENMAWSGKRILAAFGTFRPDQITTQHCRDFVAKGGQEGRQMGTTWTELSHLRICLRWAEKQGLIPKAPHIEKPPAPAPKDRHLSLQEIDRLLEASATAAPHIHLAILLMLTTAGRVGAILDLTWDRVDLERGKINLRISDTGARKGRAVVPINETLRVALVQAQAAALSDYVVEWAGRQVASIKTGFNAVVARAGPDDVSPHVLRHTAAVHMAEAGVPMEEIAQYLGHSSTHTTRAVYARYSPDHLRLAADALDFGRLRKVQ